MKFVIVGDYWSRVSEECEDYVLARGGDFENPFDKYLIEFVEKFGCEAAASDDRHDVAIYDSEDFNDPRTIINIEDEDGWFIMTIRPRWDDETGKFRFNHWDRRRFWDETGKIVHGKVIAG